MSAKRNWIQQVVNWAYDGGLETLGFAKEQFHIHHPVGRTAKHNKVHIGEWWILPVPIRLHDVHSNDPLNVTHNKRAFEAHYGQQTRLWELMVVDMQLKGYMIPFGDDVKEAVKTWRR